MLKKLFRSLSHYSLVLLKKPIEFSRKNGRLVLVTPYIVTRSGQSVTMPIGEKLRSLGFRHVQPFSQEHFSKSTASREDLIGMSSLVEMDERHKIGREIHIYQK